MASFVHDFDDTKYKFTNGTKKLERCSRVVKGESHKLSRICTVESELLKKLPALPRKLGQLQRDPSHSKL